MMRTPRALVVLVFLLMAIQIGDRRVRASVGRDRLSGAFIEFNGMNAPSVSAYLDELQSLGMNTVTTTATMQCVAGSNYVWANQETQSLLPVLMSEASKRGMHVNIGLLGDYDQCSSTTEQDAIQTSVMVAGYLKVYSQYSALAGWYLPGEMYIQDGRWIVSMIAYTKQVTAAVRQLSSLPVYGDAYLYSGWTGTPSDAASCAKQFMDGTGIDVLLYEDGMGGRQVGGIGWNAWPTMGDYMAAISASIGADHLGIIHELVNPTFGVDSGTVSESTTRLNRQIEMVPDSLIRTGNRYTWTVQNNMSAVTPMRNQDAPRLLAGYRATHGMGGELSHPKQVNWWTPTDIQASEGPAPGFSDRSSRCTTAYGSSRLIDGLVGDPFTPNASEWVGTPAFATICIDLGENKSVLWVSVHAAKFASAGVQFPQSMVLSGSVDGYNWTQLASRTFTSKDGLDGETVLSNATPLTSTLRYLWVALANTGKTRLSEIEVISR